MSLMTTAVYPVALGDHAGNGTPYGRSVELMKDCLVLATSHCS